MQPSNESLKQPMSVEEKRRLLKELLAAGGRRTEPVAIIGMSGRYPMAPNLAAFWDNLRSGRHCISEIPAERWDWREYFDPDPNAAGKTYSRWGGFLSGIDRFDPLFFGIAPTDAAQMDPQERLFLETAWSAIEDAGYTRQSLGRVDRRVGVFAGVMNNDYEWLGARAGASDSGADGRSSYWSIANRVSYVFDLKGPSFTIDSACSSSLTAIHLACSSLLQGECRVAIAGGVNLILHPAHYVRLCRARMLSAGDRCKAFGEGADGFVDGEGVGALVLKPLRDAVAEGDHIYAVIRGSAINSGGRTSGYTVPNPNAQADVIAEALRRSGVDPQTVEYVEAHGTGTALGDPIELAALANAFTRSGLRDSQQCAIGSVKSNIGHLEAAAGVAGVTKVVLQMQHRTLVPSLHAGVLNAQVDLSGTPFRVQTTLGSWPGAQESGDPRPLRAGVSSFGGGGANAHLILESYDAADNTRAKPADGREVVVLSARTPDRLTAYARELWRVLDAAAAATVTDSPELADVAYTLAMGREAMDQRLALVVSSLDELRSALHGFISNGGPAADGTFTGQRARGRTRQAIDATSVAALIDTLVRERRLPELAERWAAGAKVDWQRLFAGEPRRRVSLPTYPFAGERYWIEEPSSAPPTTEAKSEAPHSGIEYFTPLFAPVDEDGTPFTPATPGREHVVMICAADALDIEAAISKHHVGDVVDVVRLGLENRRHGREWEIRAEDPYGIQVVSGPTRGRHYCDLSPGGACGTVQEPVPGRRRTQSRRVLPAKWRAHAGAPGEGARRGRIRLTPAPAHGVHQRRRGGHTGRVYESVHGGSSRSGQHAGA